MVFAERRRDLNQSFPWIAAGGGRGPLRREVPRSPCVSLRFLFSPPRMELRMKNRRRGSFSSSSLRASSPLSIFFCFFSLFALFAIAAAGGAGAEAVGNFYERESMPLPAAAAAPATRRSLLMPGSYPPRCSSKCSRCTPCRPVHVAVPPGTPVLTEYYPEAWRCKCGGRLYMP